jgi:hypothetical protein
LKRRAGGRRSRTSAIINFRRNWLIAKDVDPEAVGRELGVLAANEVVTGDRR